MTVDDLKASLAASTTRRVNIGETVEVGDFDHLDLDGHDLRSTADPMFSVRAEHWSIRNGKIVAETGVTIDINKSTMGLVSGVLAQSRLKEVVRCVGQSSCFDTLFQSCQLMAGPNMAVPIVTVSVNGALFSSNTFRNIRFQTKGNSGAPIVPVVIMECVNPTKWIYGNRFTDINAEMPNAGLFRFGACSGTVIDNVTIYDANIAGSIIDDIIWFGRASVPGLNCIRTTVRNYNRIAGSLDTGKYDLHFAGHYSDGVLLEQIYGAGTSLRVKTIRRADRIEVQDFNSFWVNK